MEIPLRSRRAVGGRRAPRGGPARALRQLPWKSPAARGVQLVAVARRATVRRRACAGYHGNTPPLAACGWWPSRAARRSGAGPAPATMEIPRRLRRAVGSRRAPRDGPAQGLRQLPWKYPSARGVQLVAVARRAAARRGPCASYHGNPPPLAACSWWPSRAARRSGAGPAPATMEIPRRSRRAVGGRRAPRDGPAQGLRQLPWKYPSARGVPLVAVARRATVRRRACASYHGNTPPLAAC